MFQNYFVTGDYVVAGWVEAPPDGSGYAPGTISVPDIKQPLQNGVPTALPKGADIVAAYLYWATVEGNQSSFAGQQAYFNGYSITGTVLGNPNAPVSWSSGGCSGQAQGSKTMRTYRADVRPYLSLDRDSLSPTFGALVANGTFPVRLADSGSNGNTAPNALGATLVLIYRVLSPAVPLNAIVIYDGAYAPSNTAQSVSQTMAGFYQPATSPVAKLTHIVANGQANKSELVYLNNQSQLLPSLYGGLPPFPGIYNYGSASWDNPTWVLSQYGYVNTTDTSETTLVVPSPTNSGCVSWGATILSTTVQDTDGDGLLDVWEQNQGYTDAISGQRVALPGASVNVKDLFIQIDYLSNLDGSGGTNLHSHLPKEAALDAVGQAFATQTPPINVHFDLGPNIYQGDQYVISGGSGGNAISEGLVLCTDGTTLCAFPGQPAVSWKGDFNFVQNQPTLGNFQPGRGPSYHYMLFGHSLGASRSYWSTLANTLSLADTPQLVSITNSGTTATITLQSPVGTLKPGDCPNVTIPACSDANNSRITIAGALGQPALNGTYFFKNVTSTKSGNITTTTFTVTTVNVVNATYNFNNEPQLAVTYLGPTSTSGHSDFAGGGDSAITLGLWRADDTPGCQPDPSQSLAPGQAYCTDQVGSVQTQTGTLFHELGHTLTLTHGGTYYNDPNNPSVPTYEVNCKPNFLSVMNYLFQIRAFVDGGFDYSSQTMPPLNEAYPFLSEASGIAVDPLTGPAKHLTRWYSTPNALDTQLQNTSGGRYSTAHCDGTPLGPNEPPSVRVDGTVAPGGTYSAPLDWNNDLVAGDTVISPGEDLDHNGTVNGNLPFSGFSDWPTVDLQQMSARASAFGFSGGAGLKSGGGGLKNGGGGIDNDGGGLKSGGGGLKNGGGGLKNGGGGTEQDEDTATSTVDAPTGLTCSISQGKVPGCVSVSGSLVENAKSVPLTWTPPNFGQVRKYYVWRAVGSYPTPQQVLSNLKKFSNIQTLTGTPPSTTYTDPNVKNNTTYTYFVADGNKQGVQSGPSNVLVVTTKF
ncbi:MAG: hypothetical protein LAO09_18570 [Acidobacteriia bacterium]|nr:hypothetical protein [Terriglobia bacterium]